MNLPRVFAWGIFLSGLCCVALYFSHGWPWFEPWSGYLPTGIVLAIMGGVALLLS